MTTFGLSKSRIMNSLQCPKLLWVPVHEPERIAYPQSLQCVFDMGHAVGAIAQAQYPKGVLIGGADDADSSGRPNLSAALGVHEGTEAQLAYGEAIDPATSAQRR